MPTHVPPSTGKLALAWEKFRLYGRWWVARGWTSVRVWRRIVVGVLCLMLVLFPLRRPLAEWLWPDSRIQQLLAQGQHALEQGRLSGAPDAARELLLAAAALDPDRRDVQAALVSTGHAALRAADAALRQKQFARAAGLIAVARELQMPQAEVAALETALRQRQSTQPEVDAVLQRAQAALQAGHLYGDETGALPLFQQVLALQPEHMQALEGREDALSDLLLEARKHAARGDIGLTAALIERAAEFDPVHFDLPETRAALSAALEQRRRQAQTDLRRGRLARAGQGYTAILQVQPDDLAADSGRQEVVDAFAAEASRLAADFNFAAAEEALRQGRALLPAAASLEAATLALQRARQAQRATRSGLGAAERERRLAALVGQIEEAEAQGQWLVPPGRSVYDRLKAAQALAPGDERLQAASTRLLAAVQRCLDEHLRANRVRAASNCHDAWLALAPVDPQLPAARLRLAQRWLAVGSERLGRGDVAFAREALAQARKLAPGMAELTTFSARLDAAPAAR